MKALLITAVFAIFITVNAASSSPLFNFAQSATGKCDSVYDERIKTFKCIEHTATKKRSIKEFQQITSQVKKTLSSLNVKAKTNKATYNKKFTIADTNKDGLISKTEMQAFIDLLESKKQSKHSKNELKAAFDMYDANLD